MNDHDRRGGRRDGAGRKRGPDTERWSVRISPDLKSELAAIPLDELRAELGVLAKRHKAKTEEEETGG